MDDSSNIVEFPNWKIFATAEERFLELAALAKRSPEQFERMIIVYQEDLPKRPGNVNHPTLTRYVIGGNREYMGTAVAIGLLELGKLEVLRFTHKF